MTAIPRQRGLAVAVAAGSAVMVAILGGLATDLSPWYRSLHRPDFQPPDWLFGPAWTVIFACTAGAGLLAWQANPPMRAWARIVSLFAVNGLLNILWSVLFFRLHRPAWALTEVVPLWLSILGLIVLIAPVSRRAAWLLVPYLLWVAFAATLNLAVVRLNPV